MDAPAEERVPNYVSHAAASGSSASPEPAGAGQPGAGQQGAPTQRQHPNSSAQRGNVKDPSRAPSFAEKQRYGEAVVREILGATFIEEQPYTAAPRTRNDY
jgi:DNA polymerase-3 subunit gamma/tau